MTKCVSHVIIRKQGLAICQCLNERSYPSRALALSRALSNSLFASLEEEKKNSLFVLVRAVGFTFNRNKVHIHTTKKDKARRSVDKGE
jgi:hypothetical protein